MQSALQQMTDKLYWVIGGEYRDTSFRSLAGAPEVLGPYDRYEEALRTWRQRTDATMSAALMRYTIAAS